MRQQYTYNLPKTTQVQRDEDWVAHNWYKFLLWMLKIGGVAVLLWLVYGGFKLGRWTAPRPTPPVVSDVAPVVTPLPAPRTARPPTRAATSRPTAQPTAPQQMQISGSLDLVHHNQKPQTAAPTTATQPTPQNRDEAWARYLENDP